MRATMLLGSQEHDGAVARAKARLTLWQKMWAAVVGSANLTFSSASASVMLVATMAIWSASALPPWAERQRADGPSSLSACVELCGVAPSTRDEIDVMM